MLSPASDMACAMDCTGHYASVAKGCGGHCNEENECAVPNCVRADDVTTERWIMLQPGKRFLPPLLGLFALCAVFSAGLRAQDAQQSTSHGKSLLPSARRVVLARTVGPSTVYPHWDNGYLVSHDFETFQANTQNVRLYDGSGNKRLPPRFGSQGLCAWSSTRPPQPRTAESLQAGRQRNSTAEAPRLSRWPTRPVK